MSFGLLLPARRPSPSRSAGGSNGAGWKIKDALFGKRKREKG